MRFRDRQTGSRIPTVNLVPMMDVLMTVLTFFIIISMSLTGQQLVNVALPGLGGANIRQPKNKPKSSLPLKTLVLGLNMKGDVLMDNKPVDNTRLAVNIQKYLAKNPKGKIVLKADRDLPYDKVAKLLERVSKIGGDRVSLAVERN